MKHGHSSILGPTKLFRRIHVLQASFPEILTVAHVTVLANVGSK